MNNILKFGQFCSLDTFWTLEDRNSNNEQDQQYLSASGSAYIHDTAMKTAEQFVCHQKTTIDTNSPQSIDISFLFETKSLPIQS